MTQTKDKTKATQGPTRRDFLSRLVGAAGAAVVVTSPAQKVAAATVPLSSVRLAPRLLHVNPRRLRAVVSRGLLPYGS